MAVRAVLPVDTPVTLLLGNPSHALRFSSTLDRREMTYDFLDAPRDERGHVVVLPKGTAHLRWYDDQGRHWAVPITVEKILRPIPVVAIRYRGAPTMLATRREARYDAHPTGQLVVHWDTWGIVTYRTVARDVSLSSIRCFAPVFLEPPRLVTATWYLDGDTELEGIMRIVAIRARRTAYRDKTGHDVIVTWNTSLNHADQERWQQYLQHQDRL